MDVEFPPPTAPALLPNWTSCTSFGVSNPSLTHDLLLCSHALHMLECEEAPSDETVERRVCLDDEAPLLCWSIVRDRFDGAVAAIKGAGGGAG